MNFCSKCQKLTPERIERKDWSSTLDMMSATCTECHTFKFRYLEMKEKKIDDTRK